MERIKKFFSKHNDDQGDYELIDDKRDKIKQFLKKHSITDNEIDDYSQNQIVALNQILAGNIKESYENGMLCNYAGLYNRYTKNDEKQALKYYQMAADKLDKYGLQNLGHYYYYHRDYVQAEKYYKIMADNGDIFGYQYLGELYYAQNKKELAVTNLLLALEGGHKESLSYLKGLLNPLKLYTTLINMKNKNADIEKAIDQLTKMRQIKNFINKQKFLSKIGECPVCLGNDKLIIPRECTHHYCIDCFIILEKCAICE